MRTALLSLLYPCSQEDLTHFSERVMTIKKGDYRSSRPFLSRHATESEAQRCTHVRAIDQYVIFASIFVVQFDVLITHTQIKQ